MERLAKEVGLMDMHQMQDMIIQRFDEAGEGLQWDNIAEAVTQKKEDRLELERQMERYSTQDKDRSYLPVL